MHAPTYRRRRLPHYDCPNSVFFVTACLADSLPAAGRLHVESFRKTLSRRLPPAGITARDWRGRQESQVFACRDDWLDQRPARRWLEDERLAGLVRDAMLYFDGTRYDVLSYVVMPSHVHWVFWPRPEWVAQLTAEGRSRSPREVIMHSVQSFTGAACNRLLCRHGAFWQRESYDRSVRDERELERVIAYVEHNPVKAGLVRRAEEWKFSSAAGRGGA
jgi:putative transposase